MIDRVVIQIVSNIMVLYSSGTGQKWPSRQILFRILFSLHVETLNVIVSFISVAELPIHDRKARLS